jgi:hypothetical protein
MQWSTLRHSQVGFSEDSVASKASIWVPHSIARETVLVDVNWPTSPFFSEENR